MLDIVMDVSKVPVSLDLASELDTFSRKDCRHYYVVPRMIK